MKLLHNCKCSLRKTYAKIHLIDKCLMIIMFLLLVQSSYCLFFEVVSSSEISAIDTIVRTATASIFGYFLSSNFMRHVTDNTEEEKNIPETTAMDTDSIDGIKNRPAGSPQDSPEPYTNNHLQIIIATAIAIFCLIVLTIVRNSAGAGTGQLTASAQATISQFRDLISGCIGFLIGVPTTKNSTGSKKS